MLDFAVLARSLSRRSLLLAATLAWGALAAPISHEYLEPDSAEDVGVQATAPGGALPAVVETPGGAVAAPDPTRALTGLDTAYGPTSTPTSADATYRIDARTDRPDAVRYDDPFVPTVAPFKRLFAYDAADAEGELIVAGEHQALRPLSVGGTASPLDDQFYADLVVDFAGETPVRIPSVGPGARLLAATVRPDPGGVEYLTDGADNWFVRSRASGRARLVMQLAIDRGAFGGELADVGWAQLPAPPALPPALRPAAEEVLAQLGVSRRQSPRAAVEALVAHFRGFAPSTAFPSQRGLALYRELALSKKGVCRHRAYAFVITALALGVPARLVRNEAHAWVEVMDGLAWHRVDLGGAANLLDMQLDPTTPQHVPPKDPFAWPPNAESGTELMDRTRGASPGGAQPSSSAPSAGSTASPSAPAAPPAPSAPEPAPRPPDQPPTTLSLRLEGPRELRRGAALELSGSARAQGSACAHLRVDVVLVSPTGQRVALGSVATQADGRYAGAVTLPLALEVGDYDVLVTTRGDRRCGAGDSEVRHE